MLLLMVDWWLESRYQSLTPMPELPDIVVYIEALEERIAGETLEKIRLASPFLLRSVDPPLREAEGRKVVGFRRMGKRIVTALEGDLFLILHLMIAGRLQWKQGPSCPKFRGKRARGVRFLVGYGPFDRGWVEKASLTLPGPRSRGSRAI